MKTRSIIIVSIIVIMLAGGLAYNQRQRIRDLWDDWMQESTPEALTVNQIRERNLNTNSNTNAMNVNVAPRPVVIPAEFNIAVPFTTQSPFSKWTEQDNESCEEAAALMVHYFWQGKTFTKQIAQDELQAIVDFENKQYGFYKDTTAEETARFIRDLWGYKKVVVTYDITIDDIKKEVAQGRPVIVPTAGRSLGNPNFRQPGPPYHMLVVRGWTKDMIITNDPGTRKGEEYQYKPDVLLNAIHDWNGGEVDTGKKAMITIWPNE